MRAAALSRFRSHPVAARIGGLLGAHSSAAALLLFLVLATASVAPTYTQPLGTDVGQYLYVGDVLLDGGTPYVDAANNKGPLTYVLFALISLVANRSPTVVHLSLVPFTVLTASALAAYVGRFAGRPTGVVAGATMAALAVSDGFHGAQPNTEQYGLTPMMGAWWIATRKGRRSAAGAGALLSVATLINPSFAIIGPFVGYELWRAGPPGGRLARLGAAGLAGFALAALVVAVLAVRGAVDDMVEQVGHSVEGATQVAGQIRGAGPSSIAALLFDVPLEGLWVLGLAGCLAASWDGRLRRVAVPVGLWIVVVWARVKLSGYAFEHYYLPALTGIAAGVALGLTQLWRARARLALVLALVALAGSWWAAVVEPWAGKHEGASRERRLGPRSLSPPVASFIREHTDPRESVFVAGSTPIVYWLADRRAPTRIFDDRPQWGLQPEYRAERARDLAARPPAAIAFLPRKGEVLPTYARPVLRRFRFRLAYRLDGARVWLRPRSEAPASPSVPRRAHP